VHEGHGGIVIRPRATSTPTSVGRKPERRRGLGHLIFCVSRDDNKKQPIARSSGWFRASMWSDFVDELPTSTHSSTRYLDRDRFDALIQPAR